MHSTNENSTHMKHFHLSDSLIASEYTGRILTGAYSDELKNFVTDSIDRCRAFDEIGTPVTDQLSPARCTAHST